LPLRVGALATEAGEAGDANGRQTAGHYGVAWKAGNEAGRAGRGERGVADGEVEFAGLGAVKAEAGIEDLVGAEDVGIAKGDLLVEDSNCAVGLAVEWNGNGRIVDAGLLAIADADK
jgi:hypothetical protein